MEYLDPRLAQRFRGWNSDAPCIDYRSGNRSAEPRAVLERLPWEQC